MTAAADFPKILAYARQLFAGAETLTSQYETLAESQADALRNWSGTFRDDMVERRAPEEAADAEISVANMRAEALHWATTWAELVTRYNWLRYRDAVERVSLAASRIEGAAIYPKPSSVVPYPEQPGVPDEPSFNTSVPFVSYVHLDAFRVRAVYRSFAVDG